MRTLLDRFSSVLRRFGAPVGAIAFLIVVLLVSWSPESGVGESAPGSSTVPQSAATVISDPEPTADLRKLDERMRHYTSLTERHGDLEYFRGHWSMELTAAVPPAGESDRSRATLDVDWIIPGRWLLLLIEGEFFGEPYRSANLMGWDSFARNWVTVSVSSLDNSLETMRGLAPDPESDLIVQYGTLAEYLTGELNKPFKVVTRILGPDRFLREVWDLGAGVDGRVVMSFDCRREGPPPARMDLWSGE